MTIQLRTFALLLVFSAFFAPLLQAQVKFNLSLLPDQRTYLVSILPETTWPVPHNTVGGVQIVIKKEAGRPFMAGEISSFIPGLTWWDNAYVESPGQAPEYDFVCFVLRERAVRDIPFNAWVETPLFTFVNLMPNCAGPLELVENTDPMVQAVVYHDRINITQNMTVLGARGNAFSGVLDGIADCTVASQVNTPESGVKNLRVFPVPADQTLQVFWETLPGGEVDKLLIGNALGQVLKVQKLFTAGGEQNIELDVSGLAAGVYTGTLLDIGGGRQSFRFIVVRL